MATTSQVSSAARYDEVPSLPYAGFGIRLVSAILDLLVLVSVFLLLVSAAGFYLLLQTDWGAESDITDSEGYTAIGIICLFAIFLPLYFFIMWWWRGQSLGQMAVRVAVTDRDGYHISAWRSMIRTIFWPLSLLPLGFGLLPIFFDEESRALHDMVAGTVVIELP